MTLRVTFDLEEKDLKFFRSSMKQAQEKAASSTEQEITAKSEGMLAAMRDANVPAFVQQRVDRLQALIDMVRDQEWALESKERKNVLAALAYFAEPHDIIPDTVPVLGYIDDAIMIELVVTELKHEIEAFTDFCRYRKEEKARNRNPNVSRDQYLTMKRRELHSRMRRRRSARRSSGGGTRTRLRLF